MSEKLAPSISDAHIVRRTDDRAARQACQRCENMSLPQVRLLMLGHRRKEYAKQVDNPAS